jgi:N-terminal acetyltransferase B complex non-catalytic subunit
VSEVNSLKIDYLLCISKPAVSDSTRVQKFICNCLNLYNRSAKELDDSGDEACILAIMALIKLDKMESNSAYTHLLQAMSLIENLRDDSQDNYKATLLSLCVSQLLGLGSIALAAFHDLSLREIQYDTLSHLIYTRISTLHPFAVTLRSMKSLDDRHKDSLEGVQFALKWKDKAVNGFLNFMSSGLESVYFDKILEFSKFKERLERSFTRGLLHIEKRRIARITERVSILEEPISHFEHASQDNRDYYSIPDFEYEGKPCFDEQVLTGCKPKVRVSSPFMLVAYVYSTEIKEYWLAHQTLHDILQTILATKPGQQFPSSQTRILNDCIDYIAANADLAINELTPAERNVSQGWSLLQPLIIFAIIGPTSQHALKEPKKGIDELFTWLGDSSLTSEGEESNSCILPHWSRLTPLYLHLELFKAIMNFIETSLTLSKQKSHHTNGKFSVETLNKIKKTCKDKADIVQKEAREWKKRLEKNGIEDVLSVFDHSGEISTALDEVVGKDRMRKYAKEFVDSAAEALDGVTKVRV